MIEAILGYPGHVIVTMRTKTAYEITKTDNGKTVPVKIGLQPEQRNGIEYEFDVVGDMDLENNSRSPSRGARNCPAGSSTGPAPRSARRCWHGCRTAKPARTPNDYRDLAVSRATGYDAMGALYKTVKADGKLGAVVMDDAGRMVTLHDLITRKGGELAAAMKAAGDAIAGGGSADPGTQPADDTPEVPELTEEDYVRDFIGRLGRTSDEKDIDERHDEVNRALAAKVIAPRTASELHGDVNRRKAEVTRAVAA